MPRYFVTVPVVVEIEAVNRAQAREDATDWLDFCGLQQPIVADNVLAARIGARRATCVRVPDDYDEEVPA